MLTKEQYLQVTQTLPFLQRAAPQLVGDFQAAAFFTCIAAGKDVFVDGDQPEAIALLLSGVVRVYKIGETGREITLYRFGLGESCILTANAILSRKSFPAIATVEKDAEAVIIPANVFRDWGNRYELWREFVFGLLSDRLSTVMTVNDEPLFTQGDFPMKRNMSNIDRIVRVVLAAVFAFLYFSGTVTGALGIVLVVLGAVFLLTAVIAFCPLYAPFKFSTYKG